MTRRTISDRVRLITASLSLGTVAALGYLAQPQARPAVASADNLGLIQRVERLEKENQRLLKDLEARKLVSFAQDTVSQRDNSSKDWKSPLTDRLRVRKGDLIRVSVHFTAGRSSGFLWNVLKDDSIGPVVHWQKNTPPVETGLLDQSDTVLFQATADGEVKFGIIIYSIANPPISHVSIVAENLGQEVRAPR